MGSTISVTTVEEEICWFVERKNGEQYGRWLAQLAPPSTTVQGSMDLTGMGVWTNDPHTAIRFARKQDADAVSNFGLFGGLSVFASEHIFCPAAVTTLPPQYSDGPDLDRACFEAAAAAFRASFKDLSHFVSHYKVLEENYLSHGIKEAIYRMNPADLSRTLLEVLRQCGSFEWTTGVEQVQDTVTRVIGDCLKG